MHCNLCWYKCYLYVLYLSAFARHEDESKLAYNELRIQYLWLNFHHIIPILHWCHTWPISLTFHLQEFKIKNRFRTPPENWQFLRHITVILLTVPFSVGLVTMMINVHFCSQIILQKSTTVSGRGPWHPIYSRSRWNP